MYRENGWEIRFGDGVIKFKTFDILHSMKKLFLLLLDGMTGVGKTTTSELLSKQIPRVATIGLDKVKLFISDFERGDRDNDIAREIVISMTKIYFDNSISVIVDQPIKTREIDIFENIARHYSLPIYKVQLFTSPEIAFERIMERMKSWVVPTSEEQVRKNIGFFKSKKDIDFVQIDTTSKQSEEVTEQILTILES